jgi:hypothetical protein
MKALQVLPFAVPLTALPLPRAFGQPGFAERSNFTNGAPAGTAGVWTETVLYQRVGESRKKQAYVRYRGVWTPSSMRSTRTGICSRQ